MTEGFFINLLHQPGSVIAMNLDGGTDDKTGDFVFVHGG
jgi:hypothetical protein